MLPTRTKCSPGGREARGGHAGEDPGGQGRAEPAFAGTLQALFAVAEPIRLKADTQFQDLMTQLRTLEDNIEYARRYYNARVRDYNIAVSVFPSNVVARPLRSSRRSSLSSTIRLRSAPPSGELSGPPNDRRDPSASRFFLPPG